MRYFYTDPLAAAWMAKHFGMKFFDGKDSDYHRLFLADDNYTWMHQGGVRGIFKHYTERLEGNHDTSDKYWSEVTRFYIHSDSLHLLEPKEGDELRVTRIGGGVPTLFQVTDAVPRSPFNIIHRDGKPFFWPESTPE